MSIDSLTFGAKVGNCTYTDDAVRMVAKNILPIGRKVGSLDKADGEIAYGPTREHDGMRA